MKSLVTLLVLLIMNVVYGQQASDYYKRAQVKFQERNYQGAIVEYTRAIAIDSVSAVLYNNRGICKYRLELYSEAIQDYKKAKRLDTLDANVFYNLGRAYASISEYSQALISLDQSIRIKPDFRSAYTSRAKVRYALGDYFGAKHDYNLAIALTPSPDHKLLLLRANTKLMLEQYDSAISDYNKALSIEPRYYKAYVNRGMCKIEMGLHDDAITDFTLSIRYNAMNGESYYYRAMANVYKMKEYHNRYNSDKKVLIDYQICNELACSDFQKAKEFNYGKAFDAANTYCSN